MQLEQEIKKLTRDLKGIVGTPRGSGVSRIVFNIAKFQEDARYLDFQKKTPRFAHIQRRGRFYS